MVHRNSMKLLQMICDFPIGDAFEVKIQSNRYYFRLIPPLFESFVGNKFSFTGLAFVDLFIILFSISYNLIGIAEFTRRKG